MWIFTSMLPILFDGTVLTHSYSSVAQPLVGLFNRRLSTAIVNRVLAKRDYDCRQSVRMRQETVRAQCTVPAFLCNADTGRSDKNRTTDVQESVGSPHRRFVSGVRPLSAPAPHEPACRAGPAYHSQAASKCVSWQFICRASASPRHWPKFAVETE
jgi:hypothetical protein